MGHAISFGIESGEFGTNLTIDGPSTALRLSTKRREKAKPAFDHKIFRFDKVKSGTRASQDIGEVTLLAAKLSGIVGKERKAVVQAVLDYLHFVGSGQAEYLNADPDIQIHEAMAKSATGGPAVTMKAPDMSDPKALEDMAIRAMTDVADNLRYTGLSLVEALSVTADPQEGITLCADTSTGDGLATGTNYNSESGIVHLYAEGPGKPAQQLTALVGAVAMVQADTVA